MRSALVLTSVFLIAGCSRPAPTTVDVATAAPDAKQVTWDVVGREAEALICMMTFEIEGHPPFQEPVYGSREACELPPASTPLERAVERAYADAEPMLSAMHRDFAPRIIAALDEHDEHDDRLRAALRPISTGDSSAAWWPTCFRISPRRGSPASTAPLPTSRLHAPSPGRPSRPTSPSTLGPIRW